MASLSAHEMCPLRDPEDLEGLWGLDANRVEPRASTPAPKFGREFFISLRLPELKRPPLLGGEPWKDVCQL